MSDKNAILARQVRRYRNRLGVSQVKLADMAGLGSATIKRVESGKGAGHTSTLEALARVFGVQQGHLTEEPAGASEVQPLIDAWVEGERIRPRLDPPVLPEEIKWLRDLPPVFWEEIPLTEIALQRLVEAKRTRESMD